MITFKFLQTGHGELQKILYDLICIVIYDSPSHKLCTCQTTLWGKNCALAIVERDYDTVKERKPDLQIIFSVAETKLGTSDAFLRLLLLKTDSFFVNKQEDPNIYMRPANHSFVSGVKWATKGCWFESTKAYLVGGIREQHFWKQLNYWMPTVTILESCSLSWNLPWDAMIS